MYRATSLVYVFASVFLVLAFLPHAATAQTDCSALPGSHPAAANERAGVPAGTCIYPKDVQEGNGGCDYNPYQVLESKYRSGGKITPANGVGGIDDALACRLTKLFDAAAERGINVRIVSGYRSEGDQMGACQNVCGNPGGCPSGCASPGASCHQYGLAVDVSSSHVGWLRRVAPEFQLVFPYYGDHIQCAEHPQANRSSCRQECNGGVAIQPDLSRMPTPSQVPNTYFVAPPGGNPSIRDEPTSGSGTYMSPSTPSSGISNNLRNWLSPTAPFPTTPTIAQTQLATSSTSAGVCSPQFYCSSNAVFYRSSTCLEQQYQACPYGCSNGVCNSNTESATSTGTSGGKSIYDLLNEYAFGTSSGQNNTSTSAPSLDGVGSKDAVHLVSVVPISPINPNLATSTYTLQPSGDPTFVSPDLGGGGHTGQTLGQATGFQLVLSNLRTTLLRLLDILKPFGGSRTSVSATTL